jgi:hypothetical protein
MNAKQKQKSKPRSRRAGKRLNSQLQLAASMGGGLSGGKISKSKVDQSSNSKNSYPSKLAANVVRQILDPCHSPATPIPDHYHGKAEFVTSVTTLNIPMSSGGNRFIRVQPAAVNLIQLSGLSTWTTTENTDDKNYGLLNAGYKYIRVAGLCAKFTKMSAYDTPNGVELAGCYVVPDDASLFPASATAGNTELLQNQATTLSIAEGFEIGWCPSRQQDFIPFDPDNSLGDNDVQGIALKYRPCLSLYMAGAVGTTINIEVTVRYECFLLPANYARGTLHSTQSGEALDMLMSAIPQFCWIKEGGAIQRASKYASAVAGVIGGKGWKALSDGLISKITC